MADAYTPSDGLKNTTSFVSKPVSGAAARKQIQDMFDQILAFHNTHMAKSAHVAHAANPCCKVYHNTTQSVPDSTATKLAFNTKRFDTDNIHDAADNTKLTCNTAGKYIIIGQVTWDFATGSTHQILVKLNDTTYIAYIQSAPSYVRMEVTTMFELSENDYVELVVLQTSGGAKDVTECEFSMVKVA